MRRVWPYDAVWSYIGFLNSLVRIWGWPSLFMGKLAMLGPWHMEYIVCIDNQEFPQQEMGDASCPAMILGKEYGIYPKKYYDHPYILQKQSHADCWYWREAVPSKQTHILSHLGSPTFSRMWLLLPQVEKKLRPATCYKFGCEQLLVHCKNKRQILIFGYIWNCVKNPAVPTTEFRKVQGSEAWPHCMIYFQYVSIRKPEFFSIGFHRLLSTSD